MKNFLREGFFQLMGLSLLIISPLILFRTLQVLLPGGMKIKDVDFFAFGWTDAFFRSWYKKIASDYEDNGRFGYAWNDGLGLPLAPRAYNNWVTYWLLNKLGARKMMALGYLLFLVITALLITIHFGPLIGCLMAALLLASPLVVMAYTHYGKPEMFWWSVALLSMYLGFSGFYGESGAVWSLVAFCNLPIAIMLAMMAGVGLLWGSLQAGEGVVFLLAILPGIIKLTVRIYQMWRSGYMSILVSEQSGLWKRSWIDIFDEMITFFPTLFVVYMSNSSGVRIDITLAFAMLIGMYYLNWRTIYINDKQSFMMLNLTFALSVAVVSQDIFSLIVTLIIAYRLIQWPFDTRILKKSLKKRQFFDVLMELALGVIKFPHFRVLRSPRYQTPEFFPLFDKIGNNERILSETFGRMRESGSLRNFWEWNKEFFIERKIAMSNDIYTGMMAPKLTHLYLGRYNAEDLSGEKMMWIAKTLGVKWVVCFTKKTKDALLSVGGVMESVIDASASTKEIKKMLFAKEISLVYLIKFPEQHSVIEPPTQIQFNDGKLCVDVTQGVQYVIKYGYSSKVCAYIGSLRQIVTPYDLFGDTTFKCMQVTPTETGSLIIG